MGAANATWLTLRVARVVDETHDAKSISFSAGDDTAEGMAEQLRYRPGQFLTLRLPVGGRHLPRCYSMSSSPALDSHLRITVKRVSGGRGSNWLCDHAREGLELQALAPAGVFSPRAPDEDLLLFAGGSGITPVFSILRTALAQTVAAGQGRITLVYANRDERSVIFAGLLNELVAAQPQRLRVIHWLDTVQGTPGTAQLAELVRGCAAQRAFICGPGPFMEAAAAAMSALGLADEAIHIERFISLPEEEAGEASPNADQNPQDTGAVAAEVEVHHQGQVHQVTVAAGQTILAAAMAAGVELPHSCQAGMCASCMCQVKEGQVHLRHNEVLDTRDLSKGWTLACQAMPTTPRVQVRFAQ